MTPENADDPRDADPLEQQRVADLQDSQPAGVTETPADRFRSASGTDGAEEPEADIWEGGYSGKAMFGNWLGAGIISVVVVVLMVAYEGLRVKGRWQIVLLAIAAMWVGLALMLLYRKMNVQYKLTTQRFIHQSGILTRVSDRIEVIDIDDVTYHQGVIERMVGVGSIKITSSDKTHPELWLRGIENVKSIADEFDDLRRSERRRRGLHIESI